MANHIGGSSGLNDPTNVDNMRMLFLDKGKGFGNQHWQRLEIPLPNWRVKTLFVPSVGSFAFQRHNGQPLIFTNQAFGQSPPISTKCSQNSFQDFGVGLQRPHILLATKITCYTWQLHNNKTCIEEVTKRDNVSSQAQSCMNPFNGEEGECLLDGHH